MDDIHAIVHSILDRMDESWNRDDGHVPEDVLTGDVVYVNIPGQYFRGSAQVVEETRKVKATYGMVVAGHELVEAMKLADNVILATVLQIAYPASGSHAGQESHGRQMLVLVRENGTWKIAGYQNTHVRERT